MTKFKKHFDILSIIVFITGFKYIDIFWKRLFISVLILKIFLFFMKSLRQKNPKNKIADYLEVSCYGIFFGLIIQFIVFENGLESPIKPILLFSPLILSSIILFISLIWNGNIPKSLMLRGKDDVKKIYENKINL